MVVTLDGQGLFDDRQVEISVGGVNRASAERSVAGLDGVLSIDGGQRGRMIRQCGKLHAAGSEKMDERIAAILALMDGGTHVLFCGKVEYEDVRIGSFEVTGRRASGVGVVVDYEIVYRQLKAQG